jgi:uncharacterized protein with HEPN domain
MTDQSKKYLSDIIDSILLIEEFTKNSLQFEHYLNDKKTQSAVERKLGIIGEALNKFIKHNPELKLEHSHQIIGLRNRIIHSYDNIDASIIWAVLKNHLPKFKTEIERLIR